MPEPAYSPGRTALPAIKGAIAFENVTFRYRLDGAEVLKDITLQVAPGQVVGISFVQNPHLFSVLKMNNIPRPS